METKLIKNADAYSVKINGEYLAFANEDFVGYATQEFRDNLLGKLSLSNCQAVANDYDLDELAKEKYPYEKTEMFSCFELDCKQEGFIAGAKTILELIGGKKFSEEDVKMAMNKIVISTYINKRDDIFDLFIEINRKKYIDEYIQSLQQTEWDVEIVMEDVFVHSPSLSPNQKSQWEKKPKLDADGCLILKRI